jgi:PAS domain-containing protein
VVPRNSESDIPDGVGAAVTAVLDASRDGVLLVDGSGRIAHVNARAADLLGRDAGEIAIVGAAEILGSWPVAEGAAVETTVDRGDGTSLAPRCSARG